MNFNDVIVTWLNPHLTGYFSDRYMKDDTTINFDNVTNWIPLQATRDGNTTIVKFERYVKLCDVDEQDLDIQAGKISCQNVKNYKRE